LSTLNIELVDVDMKKSDRRQSLCFIFQINSLLQTQHKGNSKKSKSFLTNYFFFSEIAFIPNCLLADQQTNNALRSKKPSIYLSKDF
jgi:hypothetical protein